VRADAERNRTEILDAARRQVAVAGDALTMDAVANDAGVAVGTIYRHFPTKTDLLDAVVAESVRRVADLARAALDRVEDGAVAWDELTAFWTAVAEDPHAGRSARLAADLLGVTHRGAGSPLGGADRGSADSAVEAVATLDALLEHARDAGDLRDDVTLADLFLLMSHAPERSEGPAPGSDRARYFEIVGAGLRPPRLDP